MTELQRNKNELHNKLPLNEAPAATSEKVCVPLNDPADLKEFRENPLPWICVPKVPQCVSYLNERWLHELHPNLAFSSLSVLDSTCVRAPKGYLSKVRRVFGKHCVDWDRLRFCACVYCRKKGHTVGLCDVLPTLRKLRTTAQDAFLRFISRLPRVRWKAFTGTPLEVALRLPGVWKRVLSLVDEFQDRWDAHAASLGLPKGEPWDAQDLRSLPFVSRAGIPGLWAIGAPANVLTKVCAGDYSRWVRRPERYSFPNDPSCLEHKEFVDEKLVEMLENGAVIPVPEGWARRILPIKVVFSGGKNRLIFRGDVNGRPLSLLGQGRRL